MRLDELEVCYKYDCGTQHKTVESTWGKFDVWLNSDGVTYNIFSLEDDRKWLYLDAVSAQCVLFELTKK